MQVSQAVEVAIGRHRGEVGIVLELDGQGFALLNLPDYPNGLWLLTDDLINLEG